MNKSADPRQATKRAIRKLIPSLPENASEVPQLSLLKEMCHSVLGNLLVDLRFFNLKINHYILGESTLIKAEVNLYL